MRLLVSFRSSQQQQFTPFRWNSRRNNSFLFSSSPLRQMSTNNNNNNKNSQPVDAKIPPTSTSPSEYFEEAHQNALKNGNDTYNDPKTGYTVFTELFHLKRGKCCGSACRHCPYQHSKVPKPHSCNRCQRTE